MAVVAEAPAPLVEGEPGPHVGIPRRLPLAVVVVSKTNPRRSMDKHALEELAGSIVRHGILQPLLVRPLPPTSQEGEEVELFELVAGHRRLEAARLARLEEVPVMVRALSDIEVLEVQLVENLQRADLHPLEEAEGYRQLTAVAKYDVARIAEKIGRSPKYVYDRLKLLALTKEAKAAFLEDRITAGHAILLARLDPADQARALSPKSEAVFQTEHLLWHPEEEREGPALKTRSVRELQGWIDQHVRFDVTAPDPMLFPKTAEEIGREKKFVPISFGSFVHPEARDGRTFMSKAWKRADGEKGSKVCEHATLGVVAVGPGRGDAFSVCVSKEKCTVHWGKEIRARAKRAAAPKRAQGAPAAASKKEDQAKEAALDQAHQQAYEAMEQALLEAAAKMSPEKVLRCVARARVWEVRAYHRNTKSGLVGGAASDRVVLDWIEKAPVADIQRAVAYTEASNSGMNDSFDAFGIDSKAIMKRHEEKALADLSAKTPAGEKKPARAARAKAAGKRTKKAKRK